MNKSDLILPNEWLVYAVELTLVAYNDNRAGYEDTMFLIATGKDEKSYTFEVTGSVMQKVAIEAYNALKTKSVDNVMLRIKDIDNHLYALFI
ncbi:hypothetical protein D3C76_981240 [compost metagenome]|uniref:hypothetical protein n=1 Tax=Pseudomonas sp. GLN_2 TaxID=3367180 RepID=UPI000FAB3594